MHLARSVDVTDDRRRNEQDAIASRVTVGETTPGLPHYIYGIVLDVPMSRVAGLVDGWQVRLTDLSGSGALYDLAVFEPSVIGAHFPIHGIVAGYQTASVGLKLDAPVMAKHSESTRWSRPNFLELAGPQLEALDQHFERVKPLSADDAAARREMLTKARDFFQAK
jgi:hypothetical protein